MSDPRQDPIAQEILWVIMGTPIPIQITASGKIFVDGSPIHTPPTDEPTKTGKTERDLPSDLRPS
jgi:hypothetical protein